MIKKISFSRLRLRLGNCLIAVLLFPSQASHCQIYEGLIELPIPDINYPAKDFFDEGVHIHTTNSGSNFIISGYSRIENYPSPDPDVDRRVPLIWLLVDNQGNTVETERVVGPYDHRVSKNNYLDTENEIILLRSRYGEEINCTEQPNDFFYRPKIFLDVFRIDKSESSLDIEIQVSEPGFECFDFRFRHSWYDDEKAYVNVVFFKDIENDSFGPYLFDYDINTAGVNLIESYSQPSPQHFMWGSAPNCGDYSCIYIPSSTDLVRNELIYLIWRSEPFDNIPHSKAIEFYDYYGNRLDSIAHPIASSEQGNEGIDVFRDGYLISSWTGGNIQIVKLDSAKNVSSATSLEGELYAGGTKVYALQNSNVVAVIHQSSIDTMYRLTFLNSKLEALGTYQFERDGDYVINHIEDRGSGLFSATGRFDTPDQSGKVLILHGKIPNWIDEDKPPFDLEDSFIYPNPISANENAFYYSVYDNEILRLISTEGIIVREFQIENGHNTLMIGDLPTGMYILSSDFANSAKIIVR